LFRCRAGGLATLVCKPSVVWSVLFRGLPSADSAAVYSVPFREASSALVRSVAELFLFVIGFYYFCIWSGAVLTVMLPVEPLDSFGKRQPMSRNVFERFFDAWVGALCSALFGC